MSSEGVPPSAQETTPQQDVPVAVAKKKGDSAQLKLWRDVTAEVSGSKKVVKKQIKGADGELSENPEYKKIKDVYTQRISSLKSA
jgi:hypothetical protein